ncbi:uncharacterized protein FIBRA_00958 [Fibroporia radiculosa]|uniref:RlpA-like protein double-psi beta-barrel domain-containing protein n=1 Tax=Fibroporia radiculosa TaxID=599839 RepID=J4GJ09_9APHY|nr:uncharacterized protein FIBRA_00958 [Fibroporia radiculosa]CCL98950.1 predicted protein [Fibroporia radiculosa]
MRFPTLLSFAFLSLISPLTAAAHGRSHRDVHRRHDSLAHRPRGDLVRRQSYSNARFTYYAVGLGGCGETSTPNQFVVALDADLYGDVSPSPECFKTITITANGKTTTATIVDKCPGCPSGGLDMSNSLFEYFADLSVGVLTGSWSYGSGGGAAPAPTTSSTPPLLPTTMWTPTTTSTPWTPTTTSTPPPPPPPPTTTSSTPPPPPTTTTSSTPTTSSSSSTSSSSPTSSSPSSTASSTGTSSSSSLTSSGTSSAPTSTPTGSSSTTSGTTLEDFNQALLGLAGLMIAGAEAQ